MECWMGENRIQCAVLNWVLQITNSGKYKKHAAAVADCGILDLGLPAVGSLSLITNNATAPAKEEEEILMLS